MTPKAWSDKRERQYRKIKESQQDAGRSETKAEEVGARIVNKERPRAGEAKESSPESHRGMSSSQRGGKRSHSGPGGRTKDQLYAEAKRKGVAGRSTMNKAQLKRAVDK